MRRREFIAGLGSAAAWPVVGHAQRRALPVIGYLSNGSLDTRRDLLAAFLGGLAETGFVEGRNVDIEYRWADDRTERLPALAADLVRRQVAAIAAPSTAATALAAQAATQDIPVVFLTGADPVELGLVTSFNRPGGNLTGVAVLSAQLAAKRLELLREFVPSAKSIAYLVNSGNPAFVRVESELVQTAARVLGVDLLILSAGTSEEIDTAFQSLVQQQAGAVLPSGDALFGVSQRDELVTLAARHRIPVIYDRREGAVDGGLVSYGSDIANAVRLVGVYTGRILSGEKPRDLPIQQPTKVELVINLKTAKALGLTIPETLLATADEVTQ
jgi:putative tryptophan/tyrosine transport system substrate-binding protein